MTVALLFELAWKSGLLAGAALLATALLRDRPPAERVAVLRLGVVMILALPLLAALTPALRIDAPAFVSRPVNAAPPAPAVTTATAASIGIVAPAALAPATAATPVDRPAAPAWAFDPTLAVLGLWALGASLLLLRLGAGVVMLHRLTRRAEPVTDARWLSALDQVASRGPRPILRTSSRVPSPLSWGVRPAVILLNPAALAQADRADAVLTHEMGHVRHGDWLFLMLTRLLVAALWFNPVVWLLQRELGRQSEQVADAWALRRIDRADYASALVALAGGARPHAALGMAAPKGELARRITAIMTTTRHRGSPWPTVVAIVACAGLATPLAAVEMGTRKIAPVLRLVLPANDAIPGGAGAAASIPAVSLAGSRISAALVATPSEASGASLTPDELETVLRQRGQGLAMMEAGVHVMEEQARMLRDMAAGMAVDAEDRAGLLEDAAELEVDARDLRAEARELADRDPATLRPLSPAEEREMFEGMGQTASIDARPAGAPVPTPVTTAVPLRTEISLATGVERDASGALRTANGVQIDASGAVRTESGVRIDASGVVRAPNGEAAFGDEMANQDAENREREMREGVRQMREGAAQIEAGALATEATAQTAREPERRQDILNRAAEMRGEAAELRRRASEIEAQLA